MSSEENAMAATSSVGMVIATKGRPDCIRPLIAMIESQTHMPSIVVFSITGAQDVPPDIAIIIEKSSLNITVVEGSPGLPCQRNRGIDVAQHKSGIILFIDDDFVLADDWLQKCVSIFADNDIIALTGHVLVDGMRTGSVSWEQAADILRKSGKKTPSHSDQVVSSLYGCNMAFRTAALLNERFDEKLPLYGWMEDKELSRRIARKGRIMKFGDLRGVHLGLVGGRISGLRYGYSQIVNPYYIYKKGLLSRSELAGAALRPFAMNALKCLRPEKHIDRMGRLKGNLLGLVDIVLRRENPEKILKL